MSLVNGTSKTWHTSTPAARGSQPMPRDRPRWLRWQDRHRQMEPPDNSLHCAFRGVFRFEESCWFGLLIMAYRHIKFWDNLILPMLQLFQVISNHKCQRSVKWGGDERMESFKGWEKTHIFWNVQTRMSTTKMSTKSGKVRSSLSNLLFLLPSFIFCSFLSGLLVSRLSFQVRLSVPSSKISGDARGQIGLAHLSWRTLNCLNRNWCKNIFG